MDNGATRALNRLTYQGVFFLMWTFAVDICVKQCFFLAQKKKGGGTSQQVKRFTDVRDEFQELAVEMNNSEWAHVLLKFAYSHIDGVLLRKEQPEDFYVPRFTYINVALCRAQGSDKGEGLLD